MDGGNVLVMSEDYAIPWLCFVIMEMKTYSVKLTQISDNSMIVEIPVLIGKKS